MQVISRAMPMEVQHKNGLHLAPITSSGELNVIVETPRGSRVKYKYDEENGLIMLHKVMPTGTVFRCRCCFLQRRR